ncbi:MAG: hypothetical protein K0Q46_6469 [Rhodococcus erythropolis]|jgi:hypothetical protein|nr:hypothetical protein [Rhodococcus erythropolis]MDF2899683.1 hypothetical protein [Rhodococcus erythropolis]
MSTDPEARDAEATLVDRVAQALCTVETRSKAVSLEEVQAGIQRWTRHRYEAERLIEELRDQGLTVVAAAEQGYSKPREADTEEREALRWICHTEGLDEEGNLDGDLLVDAILAAGYSKQHPPTDPSLVERLRAVIETAEGYSWSVEGEFCVGQSERDSMEAERAEARAVRDAVIAALGAVRPAPEPAQSYRCRGYAACRPSWTPPAHSQGCVDVNRAEQAGAADTDGSE